MSSRARQWIFLATAAIFFALYARAAMNLPAWGDYRGPYGDLIARVSVYERHATDSVNAVNYDYRAFDTLGEEFILFTAATGVMMLLRRETGAKPDKSGGLNDGLRLSRTVQAVVFPAIGLMLVFGFYLGLHGQLTPGGGFQAGVVLSTVPMLIYITANTEAFKRITSHAAVEVAEASGAGAYAVIGVLSLLMSAQFLTNKLPLGTTGDVFSSGNIALISACVGVEVTAAFLVVAYAYLEEIVANQTPKE